MEVFMRNIPWALDELQLQRILEPILHGPLFRPFLRGAPFNFIVHLIRAKKKRRKQRGQKHSGWGILVLPREDIGRHLLLVTAQSPVYVSKRRISFEEGRNKPGRDDLLYVSGPYQDPAAAEEESRLHEAVSGEHGVKTLQFGWPFRDNTISVEWESAPNVWSLVFSPEDRRIILKSSSRHRVVITLGSVLSTTQNHNSCVMLLERPPIFEWERAPGQLSAPSALTSAMAALRTDDTIDNSFDYSIDDLTLNLSEMWEMHNDDNDDNDTPVKRDRLSGLNDGDNRVFAYTRVIRVVFDGYEGSNDFRSKAKRLGLPVVFDNQRIDPYRNLFAAPVLDRFNKWLATLDFEVAFQLDALVARCLFPPGELLAISNQVNEAVRNHGEKAISSCIRGLEQDLDEDWEQVSSMSVADMFVRRCQSFESANRNIITRGEDVFECHRVMVTPTALIPNGPFPDESNRVIRRYSGHHSNFLRVEFREEDRLHFRWDRDVDGASFINKRIGSMLKQGLLVAGRRFEFLAYSSSALKEHAVWFMSPFFFQQGERRDYITADYIRTSLGDFSKVAHCPARYGARLSQAFSATEPSVVIKPEEMIRIPDIEHAGSCHTDGVGTMSPEVADEIWEMYTDIKSKQNRRNLPTPSAYQIRLQGLKGMLCVDNRLEGRAICIRPSMEKFIALDHDTIEIARAFDRPTVMYLNRPLIMVLDTLGVPLEPFMQLQQDAIEETETATQSLTRASRLLDQHGLGTAYHLSSILLHLHKLDVDFPSGTGNEDICSFLQRVLNFAVNHILRDLKYRARIPIPDAWTLVGVADEWGYLEEGEIYACARTTNGRQEYIEGDIMISRSPTVHPGDARMVYAVGRLPAAAPSGLRELKNCVVFSCKGERSLPSMLAGGDLDGDIYCLVKDERLHIIQNCNPGAYTQPEFVTISRPSTANDVADFVVNYIQNDLLGLIAMQLLLTADISPFCMKDADCLKLANLHSNAVDFPKTGRPVQFNELPRPRSKNRKPDWHASETKEGSGKYYPSQRHIGHLYRAVKLPAIPEAKKVAKRQQLKSEVQRDLEVTEVLQSNAEGADLISTLLKRKMNETYAINVDDYEFDTKGVIREMLDIHSEYSEQLAYICKTHTLSPSIQLTEEEVVAGTIVAKSSQPRRRQDETSAMRRTSTELCAEVRTQIEGEEGTAYEESLLRAWTAWRVSLSLEDTLGARSFGLMSLEVAFSMMRKMDVEDERYY